MDEKKCRKCGKALTKEQLWRERKYCSRACFANARWGEKVCVDGIETRRPLVLAAAKLCREGLTRRQAAEQLNVRPELIAEWVQRYGAESFKAERFCVHCGCSLGSGKRKYCSESCANKTLYAKTHPPGRQHLKFNPKLRARALELYWGGLGQTAVADYLGVAVGTVDSWVHDFGGLHEVCPQEEILRLLPVEDRLQYTSSPTQWREALCELTPSSQHEEKTIHLVSLEISGSYGATGMAGVIFERLKQDPMSGETFAFCCLRSRVINTIFWDGDLFRIGKYPKTYGSFIWPKPEWGAMIDVRETEFETILKFRKKAGESRWKHL